MFEILMPLICVFWIIAHYIPVMNDAAFYAALVTSGAALGMVIEAVRNRLEQAYPQK